MEIVGADIHNIDGQEFVSDSAAGRRDLCTVAFTYRPDAGFGFLGSVSPRQGVDMIAALTAFLATAIATNEGQL